MAGLLHVALGLAERAVEGVALGGQRDVDGRLGQGQLALRRPHKFVSVLGRDRDDQRLRVGQPDVLRGGPHDPPGDVEWVLPGREQPGEPVERRVGLGVAQRLVEGRDQVEVLLAGLVVEGRPALEGVLDVLERDLIALAEVGGQLQEVQGAARVPVAGPRDELGRLRPQRELQLAQAPLPVRQRPLQQRFDLLGPEGLEHEDLGAGEQRADDLERRVLRRGPDEDHGALLDVGQEHGLLGLVEAVELVDEDEVAPLVRFELRPRALHRPLDLLDGGAHGAEVQEPRVVGAGDEPPEGRLARAGRPPQDQGAHPTRLDHAPQGLPGAQEVGLPHELVQGAGAHPLGQRRPPAVLALGKEVPHARGHSKRRRGPLPDAAA